MIASAPPARGLRFELARPGDDADLRALLRATPMGGAVSVAFLREPDFFRAARAQGTFVQVFVARSGGKIAAVASRAVRPSYVNGRPVDAGYLGDLRIRPEHRGGPILARGFRFLRESLHADGRVRVYGTLIVGDNAAALSTVASGRAGLPRYADLGRVLTPMISLARPRPDLGGDVVRAAASDLPEIVRRLNEERLQLAPAYREEDFLDGRFPGFRIEDFLLLRRGRRLAGVLGAWDPSSFRQTVVAGYRGWLGALRPAVNLVRRPPLPPPGGAIRIRYAAFPAADDVAAFRVLLRRIQRESAGGAWDYLAIGLHERDPRAAALAEYPRIPFFGRLFAVTFDGPPELDGRVPFVEAATL